MSEVEVVEIQSPFDGITYGFVTFIIHGCDQHIWLFIDQFFAVKANNGQCLPRINPVDVTQVFLYLPDGLPDERLVQSQERNLREVSIELRRSLNNSEFFDLVVHNAIDLETDLALHRLAQRACSYLPGRGKPARSALHAHAEFRESSSVGWEFRGPEGPRVVFGTDAACVVTNADSSPVVLLDVDVHPQNEFPVVKFVQFTPIRQEALDRVVYEFCQGEPRAVIQMAKHRQNTHPRPDAYRTNGTR